MKRYKLKAKDAFNLAKKSKKGIIETKNELEEVLIAIENVARLGDLFGYFDIDLMLNISTMDSLKSLGYIVEYHQYRPISKPKWFISWDIKG